MSNPEYSKLLRDPRWQKKRLKILDAHGFKCDECGDTKNELQVHHCYYEKDRNPWDYDDDCFKVLCDEHHKAWHLLKADIDKKLSKFNIEDFGLLSQIVGELDETDIQNLCTLFFLGFPQRDLIKTAADIAATMHNEWQRGYKCGKDI